MNILRFFFGICGNATALILFLAPLITFRRIIKTKSTQQFSGVPYIMTLLSCLLSGWYGLPFVSPHNILVTTINGIGAKVKCKMLVLLALVLIIFASISNNIRPGFNSGLAATIFSICMYASPLSVMKLVIRTKSVEYMPFFLSLFMFLCGTSWFAYGLHGGDPFIDVPNGFGCGLGALQLILYTIYRNPKGKAVGDDGASVKAAAASTTTCSSPEDDGDFIELGFEKSLQKTAIATTAATATCTEAASMIDHRQVKNAISRGYGRSGKAGSSYGTGREDERYEMRVTGDEKIWKPKSR
ncbi:hypothetical protein MKX01_019464 [Papaver californicum]|nr:hypothetical protein MKX01_019464 [Papaver californicum]